MSLLPSRGTRLVLCALLVVALMAWLIPAAIGRHGTARGIALAMTVYWFGLCLPLGLAFRARARVRLAGPPPAVAAVLALPVAALAGALLVPSAPVTAPVLALAVLAAAINGPVEELFWRGAFLETFPQSAAMQAVGVALFTAWHIPLALAPGVVFPGGPAALLGGAAAMGVVWTWAAWRGGAIGWGMVSHLLVNLAVFPGTFAGNA